MQMNRLFEIVYLLMEQRSVKASELADRFEVSVRTIYRDIDMLSGAGIPVYSSRGKGGGIHLMERFTLNKSLLSQKEQNEILAGLQGLSAIHTPDVEPVLNKLATFFGNTQTAWVDVDFSRWGGGEEERQKFALLKAAILEKRVITFDYFNTGGQKTARVVEPFRLLFKGQSWYLYGFCREKQTARLFKITRMKEIAVSKETFTRTAPENPIDAIDQPFTGKLLPLRLRLDATLAYRVYDEFADDRIEIHTDGSFTVCVDFPDSEWLYGYILSFGSGAAVLEPESVRWEIVHRLTKALEQYQ